LLGWHAVGADSVSMIPNEYREFAIELAESSGTFIRPFFGKSDLSVDTKSDQTIVTEADRGAEKLMRGMINRRFPDHGIIGEEFGLENENAEFTWVLDPIDGTISFASGIPLFGTLIALCKNGVPVLGVIHQPILGELVVGDGQATTLNGKPVRTNTTTKPEDATLLCTGIQSVFKHQNGLAWHELTQTVRRVRGWGDCYGYLMVATGRADIMTDPIMNPWDIAALIPVIRGAGGTISNWQGGDPVGAQSIVAAATQELHAGMIAVLNP
jgi:myo-inositol-1(or 4)-monophosphatase